MSLLKLQIYNINIIFQFKFCVHFFIKSLNNLHQYKVNLKFYKIIIGLKLIIAYYIYH
jgi:hypothetical protein